MKNRPLGLILTIAMAASYISVPTTAYTAGKLSLFPDEDGSGKNATGRRSGTVVHVTNLNDSGAGSLQGQMFYKRSSHDTAAVKIYYNHICTGPV